MFQKSLNSPFSQFKTSAWICAVYFSLFFSKAAFAINNGQDIMRPLTRIDGRAKVESGSTRTDGNAFIYTARSDIALTLPRKWQISWRIDLPFEAFSCPKHLSTATNYSGTHMGDILLQVFFITPTYGKWTFGAGHKWIFPTGGKNLGIGNGCYQLLPSIGIKYSFSEYDEDSYVGMIVREIFSFKSYPHEPFVHQTVIQPFLNWTLPEGWYINSSPEILYNWVIRRWFIPFDLMVGKMMTKSWVLSLEYESSIVYDYPKFKQSLELRVGYFF